MAVSDRTSLPAVFRARTPKALPSCDGARDHQTTPPSRPKAVVRARAQISSSERRGGLSSGQPEQRPSSLPQRKRPTRIGPLSSLRTRVDEFRTSMRSPDEARIFSLDERRDEVAELV